MLSYPKGWMMTGGLFFLLLIVWILFSTVVFKARYKRVNKNDEVELNVTALYGILKYRWSIPFIQFSGKTVQLKEEVSNTSMGFNSKKGFNDEFDVEKVESIIDKWKLILRKTYNLAGWARETLRKVQLVEWKWSTTIGTGDAMWTAMATGAVWSVQTSVLGVLSQIVHVKGEPQMTVNPNYQQAAFTTEWSCIAQIRFGYAILAGLQLLVRMKKEKGGVKAWQNTLFKA